MHPKHDLNRPLAWGRGADKLLPQLYPHIPGVISPNLKREVAAWIAGAFPTHTRQLAGEELLADTLEVMETLAPHGYGFYETSLGWGYWPTGGAFRMEIEELENWPLGTYIIYLSAALSVAIISGWLFA